MEEENKVTREGDRNMGKPRVNGQTFTGLRVHSSFDMCSPLPPHHLLTTRYFTLPCLSSEIRVISVRRSNWDSQCWFKLWAVARQLAVAMMLTRSLWQRAQKGEKMINCVVLLWNKQTNMSKHSPSTCRAVLNEYLIKPNQMTSFWLADWL